MRTISRGWAIVPTQLMEGYVPSAKEWESHLLHGRVPSLREDLRCPPRQQLPVNG
jgi:hypothetical protein